MHGYIAEQMAAFGTKYDAKGTAVFLEQSTGMDVGNATTMLPCPDVSRHAVNHSDVEFDSSLHVCITASSTHSAELDDMVLCMEHGTSR
jgi:hypothetical protein